MTRIKVPMANVLGAVTLEIVVTGARRARARLWLGGRVLKAAAWIMGCDIAITMPSSRSSVRTPRETDGRGNWAPTDVGRP